jgi:transcriptional regulator with PAS, ATPase and Fis domain
MKILISFVGSHDPFNEDGSDGPLLSLLKIQSFDKIYLFYNNDKFLKRASEVKKKYDKLSLGGAIEYIAVAAPDPTDYKLLYQVMNDQSQIIIKNNKKNKPEYFISTTSGTPQMATMWILLNKAGLVPGKLLQVLDARFTNSKKTEVRELDLSLDDFPQLKSPDQIKRKLSIYKTRIETLEEILNVKNVELIGKSKEFQETVKLAIQFSKYPIPVLLIGETGTGKEEFAKLIHQKSNREGAFVVLNCAGLNAQLLESEMFGYEKGAFTGADNAKEGLVESAKNGTLFLDEIGEIPLQIQAKLLRFLQDGSYRRLGANKEKKSNVRVISATNKNLEEMVKNNEFRKDLLMRINAAQVNIPPLRVRIGDTELLVRYFIEKFNADYNMNKKVEPKALKKICSFTWSEGNIRELHNKLTRLCIVSEGVIKLNLVEEELDNNYSASSSLNISIPESGFNLKSVLQDIEKKYIKTALEVTKGNKLRAAKLIGYSRIDYKID